MTNYIADECEQCSTKNTLRILEIKETGSYDSNHRPRKYATCTNCDYVHYGYHSPDDKIADEQTTIDGIRYFWDGNQICAVHDDTFVDLQESPAGFGFNIAEANASLVLSCVDHLQNYLSIEQEENREING